MPTTDPVEIVVEIVSSIEDDIAEIRAELESLGKDINTDLNVDDNGDIEQLVSQKQTLRRPTSSLHRFRSSGFEKVMAQHEALENRELMFGSGALRGDTDAMTAVRDAVSSDLVGRTPYWPDAMDDLMEDLEPEAPGGVNLRQLRAATGGGRLPGMPGTDTFVPAQELFQARRAVRSPTSFDVPGLMRQNRRAFKKMIGTLDKLRPNIMQVWNFLAALIPIFITLAGAAIGLAGGLLALGGAAAAIVGVGLLGWGDDLESSLQAVQEEASRAGSRIFDVLQPAAAELQPILRDWIRGAPRQAQKLVEPLRELTALRDELEAAGSGFVDWLARGLDAASDMDDQIGEMLGKLGPAFGEFIANVLVNMMNFVANNTEEIRMLGRALGNLFGVVFDLAVIVSFVISNFTGFFTIIHAVAEMLNNPVVKGLLMAATGFLMLQSVIIGLTKVQAAYSAALLFFHKQAVGQTIPVLGKMISLIWQKTAAWNALTAAVTRFLAVTGIGLAVAGAGMLVGEMITPDAGGTALGGGGGGMQQTNINIEGDVGRREMDRLIDKMPEQSRGEIQANKVMNNG